MNEWGIAHIWLQGDLTIRSVASLLVGMSVLSWTLIFSKFWQQMQLRRLSGKAQRQFWNCLSISDGRDLLGRYPYALPYLQLIDCASDTATHHSENHSALKGNLPLADWLSSRLRTCLNEINLSMQRGLPILASIGSTAPFIGLFGTVWGIYHALLGIGATGQATLTTIAGPVGETLIMTALGLVVAIPAILGYNALLRVNKAIYTELNRFAQDLHTYYLTGSRIEPQNTLPKFTVVAGN